MHSGQQLIRAFFALNPPEELRCKLAELQQDESLRDEMVRWLEPGQIHLTLKFLGNVPGAVLPSLERALQCACEGVRPFVLRAGAWGCFPTAQRPRVFWIGLEGSLEELRSLQRKIDRETNTWGPPDQREFHPHLTIGRIRHGSASSPAWARLLSAGRGRAAGEWRVDRVDLMQSHLSPQGAQYTSLASAGLA